MKHLLLSVFLAGIAAPTFADEIARQFASVGAGRTLKEKDPAVQKADRALTALDNSCTESKSELSDLLTKAQSMLREDRISQPLLSLAEGIADAAGASCGSGKAIDVITVYVAARRKGIAHRDSLEAIRSLVRAGQL